MIGIGLCGAHRTGKTTLARAFAEGSKIAFVETRTSAVFARMGFDPQADYDFRTRLQIQEEILNDAIALYQKQEGGWITDRTPLDMLMYTLSEVQRNNLDEQDEKALLKYTARCIATVNLYFSMVMLVQPGIELVADVSKAPINPAYIEHLNSLIMGLMVDERIQPAHFYIPRQMTDLDDRLECVGYACNRVRLVTRDMIAQAVIH